MPKVTQFVEDSEIEFMSSVSFHHHEMLRNETSLAWHSPLCTMGLLRLVSGVDTHRPAQSPGWIHTLTLGESRSQTAPLGEVCLQSWPRALGLGAGAHHSMNRMTHCAGVLRKSHVLPHPAVTHLNSAGLGIWNLGMYYIEEACEQPSLNPHCRVSTEPPWQTTVHTCGHNLQLQKPLSHATLGSWKPGSTSSRPGPHSFPLWFVLQGPCVLFLQ